jgi:hypothetical protein
MGRVCSTDGREERCIKGLVGKPEGSKPFGTHKLRWGENINMGPRQAG